jgi:hypothetical protein
MIRAPSMTYRKLPAALGVLSATRGRFSGTAITNATTRGNETMGKNSEYLSAMETQLKKWDADVDALAARSEKADATARASYHETIERLRAERHAAHTALQEMRVATEEAGMRMRAGIQVAWETMRKSLEKVAADLKS